MSGSNTIKVVARFRPQNRIELESGGQPIVKFDGEDTCTIEVSQASLDPSAPMPDAELTCCHS
jgi:kinesin family protein 5